MTVCRHCGEKIEREARFDKLVSSPLANGRPLIQEAWIDEKWLVCDETHRQWHEPLLVTFEDMLTDLRLIEQDLR